MRVLKTNIYTFDELPDDAKERAREWWRGCFAQDSEWYDYTIDDSKECLSLLGFTATDILFTGFWSQGDGACFTGSWSASDVKPVRAMRAHAPKDDTLLRLSRDLNRLKRRDREAYATLIHRYRYCHENTIGFDIRNAKRDDTIDTLTELSRDAMRWVYRQLEQEYEFMTANEQVDDAIRANEYEFTEAGKRIA